MVVLDERDEAAYRAALDAAMAWATEERRQPVGAPF